MSIAVGYVCQISYRNDMLLSASLRQKYSKVNGTIILDKKSVCSCFVSKEAVSVHPGPL